MSKKVIGKYVFTPGIAGAGTIKVPGKVTLERFVLINNSTTNNVIFNFLENGFGGTVSYSDSDTTTFANVLEGVTTLTLEASTVGMSSNDKLTIMVDDDELKVKPYDFAIDAIERMRVANPQSLIDADFEYGMQPTKWLNLGIIRNYPSFFEFAGADLTISSITTSGANPSVITVTTVEAHNLSVNSPINMQALSRSITGYSRAEGTFIVATVPSSTQITYVARGVVGTNGQSLFTDGCQIRRGGFYTAANLNVSTITSNGANPSIITVTTATKHGLFPGTPIIMAVSSAGSNHALASGTFYVENVINETSFSYTARAAGVVASSITGSLYVRPDSYFIHRPFDGGVIIGAGSPALNASAIRASKKYFRYQSGKGLFFSTGTLLKPNYDIQSVTATGTTIGSTITVTTDGVDHGLQVGSSVEIAGIVTSGFNGTYVVSGVDTDTSFQVLATSELGATTATLELRPKIYIKSWNGCSIRVGPLDDQNGIFWEFDGTYLNVCVRNSVFQISGTVAATADSNVITGTNTRFQDQLKVGDEVVIRGMTHTVSSIDSQTSMTVTPDFRGVSNVSGVRVCVVKETRVRQSDFNVDTLDGNGPSGYVINLNKMQMMAIQYSWYGAGFIDFMVRGPDGNFIIAHRFKNNNVNDEAFMRSGNLPVRYAIDNDGAKSYLTASINNTDNSLTVTDASRYPTSGTLYIDNEIISYSGKSGNTLTGLTRAATYSNFTGGQTRTYTAAAAASHNSGATVYLLSINCSPTLSHWGSAFIMDGEFNSDRGYIFNYARAGLSLSTTNQTAFMIRLSPSVSNGLVGDLGVKDLINRAQILLTSIEVTAATSAAILVEGILNPANYAANPGSVNWFSLAPTASGGQPSLAQIATSYSFTTGSFATPGETIFSFIAGGTDTKSLDLTPLKELTSTPIGGRGTFPNGPDVLAINIRLIAGSTATGHLLLRWSEAQA